MIIFWDTINVIIRMGILNYIFKSASWMQYVLRRFRLQKKRELSECQYRFSANIIDYRIRVDFVCFIRSKPDVLIILAGC